MEAFKESFVGTALCRGLCAGGSETGSGRADLLLVRSYCNDGVDAAAQLAATCVSVLCYDIHVTHIPAEYMTRITSPAVSCQSSG
jgi:hypothetical protein